MSTSSRAQRAEQTGTAPGIQRPDVVRIPRPTGGPGRGGPFAGMNVPAEKALNFGPSARRLLGELRPERAWLALVLALAVVSVAFSVTGPRLLGEGTNLIFAGVVLVLLLFVLFTVLPRAPHFIR